MKNKIVSLSLFSFLIPVLAIAGVSSKELNYEVNGETFQGFIAIPEKAEVAVPGILVVHEWWGHNDYARSRAEDLAELGYVAFALDMYGEGKKADHPQEAGAFAQATTKNFQKAKDRFAKALELLKAMPEVDSEPVDPGDDKGPDNRCEPNAGQAAPSAIRHGVAESSVRIDVDLLDEMINLVGELVLVRNQVNRLSGIPRVGTRGS